ncbi:zinc ribbon domain-containing protein [candidate division KSB1 bacterium]|nr:zinc ribbon domain-containing protein [bacterium]OQX58788.1 MAG: hypothetical protein B5M50_03910 [candidate division KSB1 bacterium 4484_219]RKY78569.1 MAG: zinc ribbon domain-containing protein [candidate division KSB1 bacterium]RKY78644.1 MAG: zinc ribbon domain-containing protein [candidate division KSB1 bacterium]RKY84726.1 MAG: zinc ribbon domain-containing protein [candidate division KSB1 bacterium]
MPTYEFCCQDCGREYEVFTSIANKEKGLELNCPQCGSKNVRQAFSSFLFCSGSKSSSSSSCSSCIPSANKCQTCGR